MKQIITLLLFVLAFSTQSYATKATVVPMVTTTTVNVDYVKKDGIFKNVKSWVSGTIQKAMDGKTIAMIAHFTVVGLVIAFIMNNDNPSSIGSFYIRQVLGIAVIWAGIGLIAGVLSFIPLINLIAWALFGILSIFMLILLIMSFINAVGGKEKPVPVLGKYFQDWFAGIA